MDDLKVNAAECDRIDARQTGEQERLLDAIQNLDVSERVAGSMIARYAWPYLWRKVRQARYARRVGVARNPAGWFIASVRNNWKPLVGFDEWAEMDPEEYREALFKSWGICRRCWRRPCHCDLEEVGKEMKNGKNW